MDTRRASQYMGVDTYMKAILKVPSSFYWLCLGPDAIMGCVVSWFATRPVCLGCGLATLQPLGPVHKSAPHKLGLRRDRQTNNYMVTTNADLPRPQRNDAS